MDPLDVIANSPDAPLNGAVLKAYIAESDPNADGTATVKVKVPSYDLSKQFGPMLANSRSNRDGTLALPTRGQDCLVSFDENGEPQLVEWFGHDTTTIPPGGILNHRFVGEIAISALVAVEPGWINCDGSAVTAGLHPGLRTKLLAAGSPYGTSGSDPKVPLLNNGQFPLGVGGSHALGSTGGVETVTLTSAQSGMVAHNHGGATAGGATPDHLHSALGGGNFIATSGNIGVSVVASGNSWNQASTTGAADRSLAHDHTISTQAAASASSAHENMPPFVTVRYLIYAGD